MKLRGLASFVAVVLALFAFSAPVLAIGDNNGAPPSPSLAQAQADIDAGDWTSAITKLKAIVEADSSNDDAFNLLGYAYRKSGNLDLAQRYYKRALKLNPGHTGALEYQGELYLMLGDKANAEANLDKIKAICGTTCEAYKDLAKAIG